MNNNKDRIIATVLAVSMFSQSSIVAFADEVNQQPGQVEDVQKKIYMMASVDTQKENEVVTQDSQTSLQRVYIYVDKVWLLQTGSTLKLNETKGWVTLGYVDVPLPAMTDSQKLMAEEGHENEYLNGEDANFIAVKNAIAAGGFVSYAGNTENITPLDSHIQWEGYDSINRGLRVSYGANDYTEDGKSHCWHLDGTYVMGYRQNVNIHYKNMLTGEEIETTETKVKDVGETYSLTAEDQKNIAGYDFVYSDKNECLVQQDNASDITLYYIPKNEKITLSIEGQIDEKIYNGQSQTNSKTPKIKIKDNEYNTDLVQDGLSFTYNNQNFMIQGYTMGNGVHVNKDGYVDLSSNLIIKNASGVDVTQAFHITNIQYGKLNITKRPITLKAENQTKNYTGSIVYADTDRVVEELNENKNTALVNGDWIYAEVFGSGTNVNSEGYPIGLKEDKTNIKNGNVDVTNDYLITFIPGKLYIVPKDISNPDTDQTLDENKTNITVNDPIDSEYNGTENKYIPEIKYKDKILDENEYDVIYKRDGKETTDFTDAGKITVEIVAKENGNFTGTIKKEYEIKPKQIYLKSEGGNKPYDGSPLTKENVDWFNKFVAGEVENVKATGSVTEVSQGKVTNTIEIKGVEGKYKESNYEITKDEGELYILSKDISISEGDLNIETPDDVNYNGNSQKQPPKITDNNGNELVVGKDYDITYSEDTTNVGTVTVKITGKGNYSNSTSYTYKIKPINLEIRVSDIKEMYTGDIIHAKANGYTVSGKLASGDEITIVLAGGKKNPGTYKNELYVKKIMIHRNGVDVTKNYTIKTIPGTLTILKSTNKSNSKINTGIENRHGLFTSLFAASGVAILVLLDRKNRK